MHCICIQLVQVDQSVPRIECKVNLKSVLIFFLTYLQTYLSWPSFQVENDFEIEFLFLKKLSQSEREHVIPFRLYEFSGC